ncbi:class I SAM-dependent methyltransferase [Paenibacillus sp. J22TS3]|uniref:class I SAM-dependent methyltransferase n=1 Tax=Paenibacillus sp. J22TS3 TaxID=2807192 RepID=UPI001BCBCCAC|nr:class I SAM-dependent methyltransferase [Paenibacillus sp. J22TS3]
MKYEDILAFLGEGAAHPGGAAGTAAFLQDHPIPSGSHILEIGCGTGRTACMLAQMGHYVTALDRSEIMLRKAETRSAQMGVEVNFVQGDAASLPFSHEQFDLVLLESVSVFFEPDSAFRQIWNVLKPGGRVYDREMYSLQENAGLEAEMRRLYGISVIPDAAGWMNYYTNAGFSQARLWAPSNGNSLLQPQGNTFGDDPFQVIDIEILFEPSVNRFFAENAEFLDKYHEKLGYGVFIAEKGLPSA